MNLQVKVITQRKHLQYNLQGNFTAMSAIEFKQSLLDTINNEQYNNIAIDLHEVSKIDITALNCLLIAQRTAQKLSKQFVVKADSNHTINHLLKLTLFDSYLTIEK